MSGEATRLRFLLDEGVPDSVGRALQEAGHEVIFHRAVLEAGAPDSLVCATALLNGCILVAFDGDMRQIAKGHGIGANRYARLNLLKLSCREPDAARRVTEALSLIVHEWNAGASRPGRRVVSQFDIGRPNHGPQAADVGRDFVAANSNWDTTGRRRWVETTSNNSWPMR